MLRSWKHLGITAHFVKVIWRSSELKAQTIIGDHGATTGGGGGNCTLYAPIGDATRPNLHLGCGHPNFSWFHPDHRRNILHIPRLNDDRYFKIHFQSLTLSITIHDTDCVINMFQHKSYKLYTFQKYEILILRTDFVRHLQFLSIHFFTNIAISALYYGIKFLHKYWYTLPQDDLLSSKHVGVIVR
jgi:hypothetical protein